jgi:hypothetical protein
VAATLLFIIETLYKAYQLYASSSGRSLEGVLHILAVDH